MPIYEYKCSDCGAVTEFLESMTSGSAHKCEKCGSENMKKMLSVFSANADGKSIDSGGSSCSTGSCPTCSCDL